MQAKSVNSRLSLQNELETGYPEIVGKSFCDHCFMKTEADWAISVCVAKPRAQRFRGNGGECGRRVLTVSLGISMCGPKSQG